MSIDRAPHLTGNSTGLTSGSDDALRDHKEHARERRAPSHDAAQNFARLMQSKPDERLEQDGQREVQNDGQNNGQNDGRNNAENEPQNDARQDRQGDAHRDAFHLDKQIAKRFDRQADRHAEKPTPLPDVFSLFARPAPAPLVTPLQTPEAQQASHPLAQTPLGVEVTTLIAASLSADVPRSPLTIDALRVDADGGQSIEIDVGSQSPALSGLTIRLAEREGRLQVDFLARDTPLFERLSAEAESIAHMLQDRLKRAVLVRVEQVGGGTSSPIESLAG